MVIAAAEYPFLNIFWTMLIFFSWVIWIWTVITVLSDVFSRRDLSGWGKAAWVVLVIVLPFIGVLAYLIGHSSDMASRREEQSRAARSELAPPGSAATEIAKAKQLLDSSIITQAEFDGIKTKALA